MDHVPRSEFSAASDRRITDRYRSDITAFLLDDFPAFFSNRSRHAGTKNQIIVRRVNNCVYVHLRNVALLNDNSAV